jgi:PPM family protein phosphatase
MSSVAILCSCAGGTDPGLQRQNNEDRYYVDAEQGIFIVIDGVGGQAAGDIAAETALKVVVERLKRPIGTIDRRLREAITLANNEIFERSESHEELRGMACVITAVVIEGERLTIGHVGDTRAYEIRHAAIRQITHDHSPVGEMEADGTLSESEAMQHPRRNEIFREVGNEKHDTDDEEFIEIIQTKFEPNDALILCTDGLSDMVPKADVLRIVQQYAKSPDEVVKALIKAANDAGGKDNVTVVVVEGGRFGESSNRSKLSVITDTSRTRTSVLRSVADGSIVKRFRAKASSAAKLLRSPWMTFLYGVALTLLLVAAAQRYLKLNLSPQNTPILLTEHKRSLVVNQSGESDYSNIGTALLDAQQGDTIQIAPGEYHEHLQLKEGVTLVSVKPREAVIRITKAEEDDFAIIASNITTARIIGLKIVGDESAPLTTGIRIVNSNVLIEDVEVAGTRGPGVEIIGDGTSTLRANFIHDNLGGGVIIRGENSRPRLVHNFIIRNGKTKEKGKPGIAVADGARPTLLWNYLAENGEDAIDGMPDAILENVNRTNIFGKEKRDTPQQSSRRQPR